jgi:hypothetical protein
MNKMLEWFKKNYVYVAGAAGVLAMYKIVDFLTTDNKRRIKVITSKGKYSFNMKHPKLMDVVLKSESIGYNDHNYYTTGNKINSYFQNKSGKPFSLLKKNMTEYSIGEIIEFQKRSRDSIGQLWASGMYQVIPKTLNFYYSKAGLKTSDKFNKENQDKIGMTILYGRKNLKDYLMGTVPDTDENLQKAALEVAKEWASVGVPYAIQGKYKYVSKNESFYSKFGGGGDRAFTDTAIVQKALRESRLKA